MHKNLLAFLLILGLVFSTPKTPQGKLTALAELGAAVSVGSMQIGEQKNPQVQLNLLALVQQAAKGLVGLVHKKPKVAEKPQPEWFNTGAAGMKLTFYDENGVAWWQETKYVGEVSPLAWGQLLQGYTAPNKGSIEVEIFNYNFTPVYFDDWHITLTENAKPEVKSPQPQRGVDEITSKTPPSGAGGLSDGLLLFNGKELQTYADLHLYDYHWRHWDASRYDPQLGRWHNIDAMADEFHGLSPYNYCLNNPVMIVDPDGRLPVLVFVAAAVIGGGLNVWNNKDKIKDIGSALGYFGVGAVGGAVAVVNPKAGFAIASLGNVGMDIATGNIPKFEKWQDVAKYGLSTGLNSLDVVGAGQITKVAFQAIRTWQTVATGANTIGSTEIITGAVDDVAFNVIGATTEVTFVRVPALAQLLPANQLARSGSRIWEVGAYNELRGVEIGLDAHHVGQKALMSRFVPNYNLNTAPSILVPKLGHTQGIGVISRNTTGFVNARQVLARDILELRRVYGGQGIPNSSLQRLIQMNKTMYPSAFIK